MPDTLGQVLPGRVVQSLSNEVGSSDKLALN